MEKASQHWMTRPTQKQTIVISLVWVVSVVLVIVALTNVFTEPLFQKRYVVLLILMLPATFTVFRVCKNFLARRNG